MSGVTLLMLIGLYLFFQFTRIGLAMRAAAALPESARLVGVNTSWMIALGWGMASAIGAVAGILIAPVVFLEPNMMGGVLVYGFWRSPSGSISPRSICSARAPAAPSWRSVTTRSRPPRWAS